MRCFISAEIPDEVKIYLASLQEEFAGIQGVNIVTEENLHATLAFLGEVEKDALCDVIGKTSGVAGNFGCFSCSLGKLEMIPLHRPRLVWISVEDCGQLRDMHSALSKSLGLEDQKFSSHITLARIKNAVAASALARRLEDIRILNINFRIERIGVMESKLTPECVMYSAVKTINLRPV